ncbi:MAG: GPP34 family phosphoprotein [Actinomycetota bacterium]|nr:GPP34 family phosphoprotein [Actinomycetota bacterium]
MTAAEPPPPGLSEPLGVAVCRLSLDPVRGRIRHPMQVGIAIRAAMFAELALSGRVVGARWPEAVGDSETGAGLLDSVHTAVANRRPTGWKRWFSHVDADRDATSQQLFDSGRWRQEGRRIVDSDPGATVLDQQKIRQLLALKEPPADLQTTILTLLVGGSGGAGGRPSPRRCRKLAKDWLPPQLQTSGRSGDALLNSLIASMVAVRRVNPIPLYSR